MKKNVSNRSETIVMVAQGKWLALPASTKMVYYMRVRNALESALLVLLSEPDVIEHKKRNIICFLNSVSAILIIKLIWLIYG